MRTILEKVNLREYGSGYGSGDGYGYGDGSGDGYGYGSGSYWAATISAFAKRLPAALSARLETLQMAGAKIAFWRSDKDGKPSNGGSCAPVTPGTVHKLPGPLPKSCGKGALHATMLPPKWKGDRCWLVALIGEIAGDEEKYWALEREIIGECLP